jgi:malate permease and related proteins
VSFTNIYQNKIGGETLVHIIGFLILQSVSLMVFSAGIVKVARFDGRMSSVFKNSIVLNNSGNFGLPVSQLVFHHNSIGASIRIVVMIFQNLLTYTYGLFNSVSVDKNKAKAMK